MLTETRKSRNQLALIDSNDLAKCKTLKPKTVLNFNNKPFLKSACQSLNHKNIKSPSKTQSLLKNASITYECDINNERRDNKGSPIKRGGKHKITFRDKIFDENKMNDLCDIVEVSFNEERKINLKRQNSKTKSMQTDTSKLCLFPCIDTGPKYKIKAKSTNSNDDVSCVCLIF